MNTKDFAAETNAEQKTISILLTKQFDLFSRVANFFVGGYYTHASIGLSGDEKTFFSFNTKRGFCIEKPIKKKRKNPCVLYQIQVPEQSYDDIVTRIEDFRNHANKYKYSFIGVLLCLLHIPFQIENRYFCSQFVSELLTLSGAAKLKKKPTLYLPKHFSDEPQFMLSYKGTLSGLCEAA